MDDELTSVYFSDDDYKMILEYKHEIEATDARAAIMNAISLALDYQDNK